MSSSRGCGAITRYGAIRTTTAAASRDPTAGTGR
jgi:hypothetical protein